MPKIHIEQKDSITKVFIDGKEIQEIRGISFVRDSVGSLPILRLEMNAFDLSLDTQFLPALPAPWDDFYEPKVKESFEELSPR